MGEEEYRVVWSLCGGNALFWGNAHILTTQPLNKL